jgi:hypothetical protein
MEAARKWAAVHTIRIVERVARGDWRDIPDRERSAHPKRISFVENSLADSAIV